MTPFYRRYPQGWRDRRPGESRLKPQPRRCRGQTLLHPQDIGHRRVERLLDERSNAVPQLGTLRSIRLRPPGIIDGTIRPANTRPFEV